MAKKRTFYRNSMAYTFDRDDNTISVLDLRTPDEEVRETITPNLLERLESQGVPSYLWTGKVE